MKKLSIILVMIGCMIILSQPLYSQTDDNATTGSLNGHEWVDLGLSVKWATCNVGAKTAEEYGNYYAWGETKPKDNYSSDNSVTFNQSISDFSGNPQYDAATANWGEGWKMPTLAQMEELSSRCTWEWIKQNGVRGYKVTGPNGNIIFLPASGYRFGTSFTDGSCGYTYYWSSTPRSSHVSYAYYLRFGSGGHDLNYEARYCAYSVRPVRDAEAEVPFTTISAECFTDISVILKIYASSPGVDVIERGFYWGTNPEVGATDNNVVLDKTTGYITKALVDLDPNTTYYLKAYVTNSVGTSYSEVVSFTTLAESEYNDYVDLGLPSGLKWAAYNIGATTATEYGDYYAWGEVVTKEEYTEANSETYGESMSDIAGTEYDVATVNWGGDWRMPSNAEIQELIIKCNWEWTTQGGKQGYKVTGLNGNHIFIPAAGYRSGASLEYAGSRGRYWSSAPDGRTYAYYLGFNSGGHGVYSYYYRYYGCTVRPVRE